MTRRTPRPLTRQRSRPLCAAFAIAISTAVAVLAGCSGDDASTADDSDTTRPALTTTTAPDQDSSGPLTFSSEVGDEWGPLTSCPLPAESTDPDGEPADDGVEGVLAFGKQMQTHVVDCVDYPVHPPVGGAHFRVWANCGMYTSPVPEMAAVHVLEHGGVWITFPPTISPQDAATIRAAADATTHVLASPSPGQTSAVILTSWSHQLKLDAVSDPRFDEFIETYLQGPDTPELGATCSGGIGTPLS